MTVLKWGIAAAGRATHDFVNALSTLESSLHSVVAVADVVGERAADFAKKHQILRFYDGFDALALDKEVQIVYVGTLNPYHYAVVRLMLERGKHVLCAKPLCLCHRQATELYSLAKQKGLFLMEGMWSRFFPSYQRLRELIMADSIGVVHSIEVRHGVNAANIERITSRALGGSILLDIGLYAVQLGQFIFRSSPISVRANAILNDDGVDVDCHFKLNYGEQRSLTAVLTAMENLENHAKIIGSKGEIKLSNYWCCTLLTKPNGTTELWPLPSAKFEFHHPNACGLRFEAEEVRKCLEKYLLECPSYTHAESLEVIEILDEMRRQIGVKYDDVCNIDA